MRETVDLTLQVDPETAEALRSPGQRVAMGRYLSLLLKQGRLRDVLAEEIHEAKLEARENGLTDADVEAELEAWRTGHRA